MTKIDIALAIWLVPMTIAHLLLVLIIKLDPPSNIGDVSHVKFLWKITFIPVVNVFLCIVLALTLLWYVVDSVKHFFRSF